MWLIVKFLEELTDKRKAKKIDERISEKDAFETLLNDTKTNNRQEILKELGKDNSLSLDTILSDEILGFEVFTSDKKCIGTISSNISEKLEIAMGKGLEPYIENYAVTIGEDGIYNCMINLGLKKY